MPSEPTILVKKADGTTARLTLSEVKALQKNKSATFTPPPAPEKKVSPSQTVAPILKIAELTEETKSIPIVALPAMPPAEKKDAPQSFIHDDFSHPFEELPVATKPFVHPELQVRQERVARAAATVVPGAPKSEAVQARTLHQPAEQPSDIFSKIAEIKPRVVDVRPPQVGEVGPIDEIRMFSVVDFRRLSQKPTEAAARLGQKFENLKSESVVLYLSAIDAWRQSPLYRGYLAVVADALNSRQPLAAVATSDRTRPQTPEIEAIIDMEKSFIV